MHAQTPPERRAFESPEFGATAPPAEDDIRTERNRSMALPLLIAVLVLAAIIVVVILA